LYDCRLQRRRLNQSRAPIAWSRSEPMQTALNIVMIIGSILLIALILMQTKGSSFTGAFGSDAGSINRTRRGVEKTLFQFTIGTAAVYVLLAIASSFLI
jgi:preprotein translocase subunit SecG